MVLHCVSLSTYIWIDFNANNFTSDSICPVFTATSGRSWQSWQNSPGQFLVSVPGGLSIAIVPQPHKNYQIAHLAVHLGVLEAHVSFPVQFESFPCFLLFLSVTPLVLIFVATFFFLQVKFIRRLHDFDLRGIEADPKVRVLMVFPPVLGLVVEPAHLKKICSSNWIISPNFRGEHRNVWNHHLEKWDCLIMMTFFSLSSLFY